MADPKTPIVRAAALLLTLAAACAPGDADRPVSLPAHTAPAAARVTPLAPSAGCTGRFVEHALDFVSDTPTGEVVLFDSHGTGVAAGDLDGDGLLDLVFANLGPPSAILWNEGGFRFRRQDLALSGTRGVAVVDADGDGRLDIAFTQRTGPPLLLRNEGATADTTSFARVNLGNVTEWAYSMAWADFNADGRLDLATASYNAELFKARANDMLFNRRGGVVVYTNLGGFAFEPRKLDAEAQGLALLVMDYDADGRPDLFVGNDFDMLDRVWMNERDGWRAAELPKVTTHSTMALTQGDVDNDGAPEIFASDMKPYDPTQVETWVEWLPAMQLLSHSLPRGNPQVNENMLYKRSGGEWRNTAQSAGVDASGWAWSAQFGDLDRDGFLDLYVVNGMIDAQLFHHLPNHELVERNQAYRNLRGDRFSAAPEWGLGSTASGRGMVLADLNNDGRLDAAIANLRSPAQVFENDLCGGAALEVELKHPNTGNPNAVGATLELRTSAGALYRDIRVASGCLSADSPRAHFAFAAGATPEQLIIRWPDGATSIVRDLTADTRLELTR